MARARDADQMGWLRETAEQLRKVRVMLLSLATTLVSSSLPHATALTRTQDA